METHRLLVQKAVKLNQGTNVIFLLSKTLICTCWKRALKASWSSSPYPNYEASECYKHDSICRDVNRICELAVLTNGGRGKQNIFALISCYSIYAKFCYSHTYTDTLQHETTAIWVDSLQIITLPWLISWHTPKFGLLYVNIPVAHPPA